MSIATELAKETRMGAQGTDTQAREIRRIDLSDLANRRFEIADQLWDAAVDVGFFQIAQHGIDPAYVTATFAMTKRFFAPPQSVKAKYPHQKANNVGWGSRAQIRPSTGTPDQKEPYQITRPHMGGLWPSEQELIDFQSTMLGFERQCWSAGMKVLSCFAYKLGFAWGFFEHANDPYAISYQSTLRLLHYFAIPQSTEQGLGLWRAGAHTDFDCLTLLFQQAGQGGLHVCPGKEMESQA
jgi:isopenicillin N synthase-like dioxygenase